MPEKMKPFEPLQRCGTLNAVVSTAFSIKKLNILLLHININYPIRFLIGK